jgi:hypothetical protein
MSISQKSSQQSHEAIVFFAGAEVSKEMLYTEFEALLDCVVPMRDFAGREIRAAYVRLDAGLSPSVVVLFLIPFDADGFPEQSWNLPLRQLAELSERSPDPAAQGVRLASRAQCSVPGCEKALWDVEPGPRGSTLERIRERLAMNRLGLDVTPTFASPVEDQSEPAPRLTAPSPAPATSVQSPSGTGSETMLALMQQSNLQMGLIREQSEREIVSMQQRLLELQQRNTLLEAERSDLLRQSEQLSRESATERGRSGQLLQQAAENSRINLETLRAELQAAASLALAEQESALQAAMSAREQALLEQLAALERRAVEQLGERDLVLDRERAAAQSRLDAELAAREQTAQKERLDQGAELARLEEQLHSLSAELTELRRDKLRLMGDGSDRFFSLLKEKNVKFVAFQPGAGHLTVPVEDLSRFLDDTETFVAEKCGVSVEHYRRWLLHYNNPVCQGTSGSGAPCAKSLQKVLKPADFTAGLQDRCEIHKQVPRSQPLREAAT